MNSIKSPRQSNYELLRLFSMFLIVWYHMYLFVLEPDNPEHPMFKAVQMPLHAGVPLFVMISGYFGIRFSFRGLLTLLARVYLYVVPISLLLLAGKHPGLKDIANCIQVIGTDGLWFVNTYLCLYIVAPVLKPFGDLSTRQRWVVLAGLAFMSIYVGDIKLSDTSLVSGKNLLNFIFLYLIGSMVRIHAKDLERVSTSVIIAAYALLSVFTVAAYLMIDSSFVTIRLWMLSYPYNSPLLIISCIMIMILFGRIRLQSERVNWVAGSVFAIYLIHAVLWRYVEIVLRWAEANMDSLSIVTLFSFVFSIVIMAVCIAIDKLLSPVWSLVGKQARKIDEWYNHNLPCK